MKIKKQPKVLTFDCYGTLIDWEAGQRGAFAEILARKNTSVSLDEFYRVYSECHFHMVQGAYQTYRDHLKGSLAQTLAQFDLPYDPEDGNGLAASMPFWTPFPEVPAALEKLKKRYQLCIISNTDKEIIAQTVKLLGTTFDLVVTAMDAQEYKPNEGPFLLAKKQLGVESEDILHINCDLLYDVKPAQGLGWATMLVTRGAAEDSSVMPDYTCKDFHEVLKVLEVE